MTHKEWLQQLFDGQEQARNGHRDHPHAQFRRKAFQQLQTEEFPGRKEEDWKYTQVSRILDEGYRDGQAVALAEADLAPFHFGDLAVTRVVFINGRLNRELSQLDELPAEVSLQPLAEALEDSGLRTWIELQTAQPSGTAKNAFLPLNRAFAEDGLVLTVGRNYRLERPI
ncbi:MAG: hypothetical protein KDC54_04605, partial [Lewinella sp.]|nr:hypothetical protein [Lewinella sp.]